LGLALICGAPLLFWNTTALLPMAAMAAIAGWGYAQPPLSLKYRGWGELAILLASGPALVLALSWCFFGRWNLGFVSLGFCVGFWNLALHHAGNLPDVERDRDQGAVTWVTLFGFRKARWLVLPFYFLGWVSLFPAIPGVELNPIWVLGLAVLLPFQLQFALRLSRASGCHSVWLAGLRKRAARVQWVSYWGALAWTWGVIQIFGGLK
jgi:1,4-dihydroxy-2-naphthoate octaprenyltransferase